MSSSESSLRALAPLPEAAQASPSGGAQRRATGMAPHRGASQKAPSGRALPLFQPKAGRFGPKDVEWCVRRFKGQKAGQPATVRRYRSCLDTGTHRSSGVAPPPPLVAEAERVSPFERAGTEKRATRKRAAPCDADAALVAASQERWAAAAAAGAVTLPAKKTKK